MWRVHLSSPERVTVASTLTVGLTPLRILREVPDKALQAMLVAGVLGGNAGRGQREDCDYGRFCRMGGYSRPPLKGGAGL